MKPADLYAYCNAEVAGAFFVIIKVDQKAEEVQCLSLPSLENEIYPVEDFIEMLEESVVEYVDSLPEDVFVYCKAEHSNNNKLYKEVLELYERESTNRRQ